MIKLTIPNKLGIEIHCDTSAEVVELLATFVNQPEDHRPPPEMSPRTIRRKKTEVIKTTEAKRSSCAKEIRGFCVRRFKGQCEECATNPE